MFFNISHNIDNRFPCNFEMDFATFNCDRAWQKFDCVDGTIFAKGYCDIRLLQSISMDFEYAYRYPGNFSLVRFSDVVEIQHNSNRGFPLRFSKDSVTNLFTGDQYQTVWADESIKIDSNWKITTNKIDLDTAISTEPLTVADATDKIFNLLVNDLVVFASNNDWTTLKLFCSGGLDTLLIYSLLKYTNTKFDLLTTNCYEIDDFINLNQTELEKNWAYKQIHYWKKPSLIATGSCGDEYFLRGPAAISMLAAWHNIEFSKLLAESTDCYHYHHFSKYDIWQTDWDNREILQQQYPTKELLNQQILNMLLNDHQHWHLGNTLTYTPFKNIEITKILLQCSVEDLLFQFLDGQITKNLIARVDPILLTSLSKYKNVNSDENLSKLIDYNNQ